MPEPTRYRQARFVPPAGATELLIVRHGESAPAVEGQSFAMIDGHGDPPLAPEGREQAQRVSERLAPAGITAIYTSNLSRTIQTAQPLVARLGITPNVDPDLREVHLGAWEGGLFRQKVAERDPVAERMTAEESWEVIPGAERAVDLVARVEAAVNRIAAAHPDERVAVFTHGGIIGTILARATGSRPFAFVGAANASISLVVVTPQRWIVRSFNDTAHLPPG